MLNEFCSVAKTWNCHSGIGDIFLVSRKFRLSVVVFLDIYITIPWFIFPRDMVTVFLKLTCHILIFLKAVKPI